MADFVIVLCRLMTRTGRNLGEEVAHKMAINRARQWNLTADGRGYHVRDSMFSRLGSAMMKFAPDLAQELVNRCQNAQRQQDERLEELLKVLCASPGIG